MSEVLEMERTRFRVGDDTVEVYRLGQILVMTRGRFLVDVAHCHVDGITRATSAASPAPRYRARDHRVSHVTVAPGDARYSAGVPFKNHTK